MGSSMRIISRRIESTTLTEISVIEAGEEQVIGTMAVDASGKYRVRDVAGNTAIKIGKSEALDWLLVQAGFNMGTED